MSHDIHFQEREEDIQAENGEELGTNGEDQDDNCDFISHCAFPKSTRNSKFVWTETSDRQLVIQYVRYHAELGVKFYRTFWATLPDLPAPPEACKRRMSSLKKIPDFRREILRLCNLLGYRYVNHLQKSKEKELQIHDGFGNIFLESDYEDHMWDDFEDQKVRRALDEVLCCLRVSKTEGGKRDGTSPERDLESQARVGGNGSQAFVLSQQFMHRVSTSPFPVNTGKRASKFASWLREREKSLMEEEIHLNADLQCGDIFNLLALVSSGELCISPCLPEEGVGDVEEKRNSKRKTYKDEICNSDQVNKPAEGECSTRREKGFPGIKVSLICAIIPRVDCGEVSNNEKIHTRSSWAEETDQSMGIGGDGSFVSAKLNPRKDVGSSAASSVMVNESPWKAMADYGDYLMSNLSDEDRVGPLYPEIFQNLHSAILKSGDQGLSMLEIAKVAAIRGGKMAELVVDVLQVFGLAMRVNGYDDVHVVDT